MRGRLFFYHRALKNQPACQLLAGGRRPATALGLLSLRLVTSRFLPDENWRKIIFSPSSTRRQAILVGRNTICHLPAA